MATAEKEDEENKINKDEKEDDNKVVEDKNKAEEENKYTSFPNEELEDNLKKENINGLISILNKIDENSLAINDRMIYNKAQEYVEKNAVGYYLKKGNSFLNDENYEKALQEYEKGMEYFKKGVWFGEDIVFRLASLNIQLAIVDDAIKYCDMLHEYYSDSGYYEDTIYQAAIFMKSRDISKAKEYALKLKKSHPDSSYINDKIEEILSQ